MTDHFALLGLPCRPWLDAAAVKDAFVAAAAECHPDRLHDAPATTRREAHERYTALNNAHLCLRSPRTRLRHWLELQRGEPIRDLQEMPSDLMARFARLNDTLSEADQHLLRRARERSPLIQAGLLEPGERILETLTERLGELRTTTDALETRARELDRLWEASGGRGHDTTQGLMTEMEQLYRLMSFHERWQQQVHTRINRLQAPP